MEYSVKLEMNKEDLQILEGFRLLDDDFMRMVFQENKEATGLLLQTVKKGQQKLAFFDIIKSGVRTC